MAQHLEQPTGDAVLFFYWLVRICVGTQGYALAVIARAGELFFQLFRGIGFVGEAGFKIQPGRQVQVGVSGPGVAIDTAMFTALLGVDRLVERNVRRAVA